MQVLFAPRALEDWRHWEDTGNTKTLDRITALIAAIRQDPFDGIGKPEPLRGNWTGFWSRRINQTDRLVYRVKGKGKSAVVEIAQCRLHY
ncbi:MAG: addiction module protein [Rhodospirillales bacterium]|nr:addiction module protein [Rhodospirillales bacterium]